MAFAEFNAIINECKKFAKNEISPGALDADLGRDTDWVKNIWKKSMTLDLPVLSAPETYDGAGYPGFCCALVLDVLASECPGLASVFAYHYTACLLGLNGNNKQKENFFRALRTRDDSSPSVFSVIFPSEDDKNGQRITEKHGELFLSGESDLTGNNRYAQKMCVFARDGDMEDSITCVIIDRGDNGISFGENSMLPGLKVNPFLPVCFNNVKLDVENIIGIRGGSSKVLEETRNNFFSFIAAMAMGSVRSSWRKAIEYAEERYQFGKKIIHHQEIQRMLGEMMMKLKIGTSAYRQSFEEEHLEIGYSQPDTSLTKAFCTDAALEIILDAIQIHGGYGCMHEYGLEKIMRDVKVLQVLGGKNPCHHMDAVSKKTG